MEKWSVKSKKIKHAYSANMLGYDAIMFARDMQALNSEKIVDMCFRNIINIL